MPWDIVSQDGKKCVRKKATGEIMHCYSGADAEAKCKDYMAALYANEKEFVSVTKEDGRWRIQTVSTAALKDRESETFDIAAIDYDSHMAEMTGDFPEYRLFHKKALPIGKVDKMYRVGIFAVDEGWAYDDPFSQEVCEKMLAHNEEGKWRCSRGFYVLEASGACPACNSTLLVKSKHMVAGFRCPTCKSVHINYKGVLKDLHFRKAKTFDVTITDNPAVPWTGVSASKPFSLLEDTMTKQELKEKLLNAGLSEDVVNTKLKDVSDAQLKEFADLPDAEVLKEFDDEKKEQPAPTPEVEEQVFVLDETSLKEFSDIVRTAVREEVATQVKEALDGVEIEVPDVEVKELPQLAELSVAIAELKELLGKLVTTDEKRLKEKLEEMPRNGKLRIMRLKSASGKKDDENPEEDTTGDGEEGVPVKGKKPAMKDLQAGVVYDVDGGVIPSLTEFVMGSNS